MPVVQGFTANRKRQWGYQGSNANLITLMFTLNEMVSAQGKVPTTKFLIELISSMKEGALILVSHVAPNVSNLDCGLANLFCV